MKVHAFWFSIFIHLGSSLQKNASFSSHGGRTTSLVVVDALISSLKSELWEPHERPCLRDTLEMLRGVKNDELWAVWDFGFIVWESMQLPAGSLSGLRYHPGNYDQCLRAPWTRAQRSQFCLVDVAMGVAEGARVLDPLASASDVYRIHDENSGNLHEQTFGVCLPASCRPSSVAKVYRHIHKFTLMPDGRVTVDPRDCQVAGQEEELSKEFYVFWSVVAILVITAVFSTLCNKDETKNTTLDMIKNSFCIKRNSRSLFKVNKDEIKVMNGIRFLTSTVIVLLHEAFYSVLTPVANIVDVDKQFGTAYGNILLHLEIVVDTFLALSGLLLVRGLMMGKQKNVFYTLVKRYLRLIGPYAFCILYLSTGVILFSGSGPFWKKANRMETDVCKNHWWRSLLMINNDVETLCHVVSWYVSCDFQLVILSVILFCIFRRNKRVGVAAFIVTATGLTFNLGWNVYWKQLAIIPFNLKIFYQLRNYTSLNYTYVASHSRAGPYFVGMVMGYILTTYKPAEHRNIISKKWSTILITISLVTMTTMLSIGAILHDRPYDPLVAAVGVCSNRVFWALGVCCIIGVCEYGRAPLVSGILSWSAFVPVSRLTYGIYLLHPFIFMRQKTIARYASTYDMFNMIINSYAVLMVSCVLSFMMYLTVEAPCINISNALFTEKTKPEQNGVKKNEIKNNITTDNGVSYSALRHSKKIL